MDVRDVMTTEVHVVTPEMSFRDAARLMREHDIGSLPVHRDDRLVGMVTDRDLVVRGLAEGRGLDDPVSSVMSEGVKYCYEDQAIEEVAANMSDQQIRRLPVVSREKRLVGFVSLANIASARNESATEDLLGGTATPH
jgi:CBS domain-containing protein